MGMRHALVGVFVFGLFGCQSGAAIGTLCERNSECSAPLVCRLERCRVECVTARDCNAGEVCLIDQSGAGACEIPTIDVCAVSCDVPLICANGHCREACVDVSGCPGGHVCTSGACQRADGIDAGSVDVGAPDANVVDAGSDAGELDAGSVDGARDAGPVYANDGALDAGDSDLLPLCNPVDGTGCDGGRCILHMGSPSCAAASGSAGLRDTCSSETDCGLGLSCQGRRCVQLCYRGDDAYCGLDLDCDYGSVAFQDTINTTFGIGLCTEACDPLYDVGCPAGATCAIGVGGGGSDFTWCREIDGTKQDGDLCGQTDECLAGFDCYYDNTDRRCRRLCASTPDSCPTDRHCVDSTHFHGRAQVGACVP